MKAITILIVVLLLAAAIFYFTKPSDERCREAAMNVVTGELVKVPGYSDPNKSQMLLDQPQPDKFVIKDKFFWKEISYVYPQSVRKIGSAYLGSFHFGKTSKEP